MSGAADVHSAPHIPNSAFDVPPPPWNLRGAAMVLPQGIVRALALVHYEASPVGPYDELAVIALTRRGPSVVEMQVTSEAAMNGGRRIWGYPKRLAPLRWQQRGQRVLFSAGKKCWRLRPWGPSLPLRIRSWTAQVLDGHLVRVPVRLRGRVRMGWNGRRIALLVESMEMTVLPAQKMG